MKLKNKRAMAPIILEMLIKIVIVVIVFIILISTFTGMWGRTKKSVLDLVDKQYKDFDILGDSFVNPGLPADYRAWWANSLLAPIRAAIDYRSVSDMDSANAYSKITPCIGAFYTESKIDVASAKLSFVEEADGITILFRDGKGVVGAVDNKTFRNTDKVKWNLCLDSLTSDPAEFVPAGFTESAAKNKVESVNLQLINKPYDGISIEYNTKETLTPTKSGDAPQTKSFKYFAQRLEGDGGLFGKKGDRYAFYFYVLSSSSKDSKDRYFCIMNNVDAQKRDDFQKNLFSYWNKKVISATWNGYTSKNYEIADELSKVPFSEIQNSYMANLATEFTSGIVNSEKISTENLCRVPSGDGSVYNGVKTCYYLGCQDFDPNQNPNLPNSINVCSELYRLCPKTCFVSKTDGNDCMTCDKVSDCSDYGSPSVCKFKDPCQVGPCKWTGSCVKAG